MNVNREKKDKMITGLKNDFNNNGSFYLVDFINMSVSQAVELRKKMRENNYSIKVVKNRLALRALKEEYPDEIRDHFTGPTAIAYAPDDPIGLARLLKEFSLQNKILKVKAGLLEGHFLEKDRFGEIAGLTSKKDLLAKIGFLMASPLTKFLRTWQAPFNGLGSMLSQLKSKK